MKRRYPEISRLRYQPQAFTIKELEAAILAVWDEKKGRTTAKRRLDPKRRHKVSATLASAS